MIEPDSVPGRPDGLDPVEVAALLEGAEERLRQPAAPDDPDEIRVRLDPDWPGYRAAETDREPEPKHGDHGTCATCGGQIEYYEATTYNGDVLASWWSHRTHPADNHDAQLGVPA